MTESKTPVPANQFIVVADISGSRSTPELKTDQQVVSMIIDNLGPRDQLVLMQAFSTGRQPGTMRWQETMPDILDPVRPTLQEERARNAIREDMGFAANRLFSERTAAMKANTDLIATLFTVSDIAKEVSGRRTTLVLLSDMIQDAQGVHLDRAIPGNDYLHQTQAKGLVPDLANVCVTAIGPDPATAAGVQVREFWRNYFATANAKFSPERYRQSVSRFATLLCAD